MYLQTELYTDRFILKTLTPDLVGNEYLSWFSNKEDTRYIVYSQQAVTLEGLRQFAQEKLDSPDAILVGIFDKVTHKHIGNIKFEPFDFSQKTTVLGVLIGNLDWRGKGVFSEIYISLRSYFKQTGIKTIYLGVEKENEPAFKAYIKNGFSVDPDNFLNSNLEKAFCLKDNL